MSSLTHSDRTLARHFADKLELEMVKRFGSLLNADEFGAVRFEAGFIRGMKHAQAILDATEKELGAG